jgi:hypothetical protein
MDEKWFKLKKKLAGVTNAEIAKRLGRDHTVISKLVSGSQKLTLEWAHVFAEVLDVPIPEVLEKFGAIDPVTAQELMPGFRESDIVPCVLGPELDAKIADIAKVFGGDLRGIEVWRVKSRAMALAGFIEGDLVVVDTFVGERLIRGDIVLARVSDRKLRGQFTVMRRYEPPVLVAACADPNEAAVYVMDGVEVSVQGKIVASWRSFTPVDVLAKRRQ